MPGGIACSMLRSTLRAMSPTMAAVPFSVSHVDALVPGRMRVVVEHAVEARAQRHVALDQLDPVPQRIDQLGHVGAVVEQALAADRQRRRPHRRGGGHQLGALHDDPRVGQLGALAGMVVVQMRQDQRLHVLRPDAMLVKLRASDCSGVQECGPSRCTSTARLGSRMPQSTTTGSPSGAISRNPRIGTLERPRSVDRLQNTSRTFGHLGFAEQERTDAPVQSCLPLADIIPSAGCSRPCRPRPTS